MTGTAAEHGRRLAVVPQADGPQVRLAIGWAIITALAAVAGALALATWLGVVAAVAGARGRAFVPAAAALALPLAALAGGTVFVLCAAILALVLAGLSVVGRLAGIRGRLRAGLLGLAAGTAAAGPVLARGRSLAECLALLALVAVFDASAYLVGTGAGHTWEGPAAGVAAIGSVTLAIAAVVDPPFRGASPWLLGGLVAFLAPFGPPAASWLLGDARTRAPALRRLDSLLLVSPVWAIAAPALLRR